jgi:hypothetical protein
MNVARRTVDLSAYPDLVVIYLGMRVRTFPGIKTLLGLGPQIEHAGQARPDGLLHFENNIIFQFYPLHVGMRWYWRDFESMERWTRSETHARWWTNFLRDSGGTGFWHEAYMMRGKMEGVYADMVPPFCGFQRFAPVLPAKGPMFSARQRVDRGGETPTQPPGTTEKELY